jgi:hypothetical protein
MTRGASTIHGSTCVAAVSSSMKLRPPFALEKRCQHPVSGHCRAAEPADLSALHLFVVGLDRMDPHSVLHSSSDQVGGFVSTCPRPPPGGGGAGASIACMLPANAFQGGLQSGGCGFQNVPTYYMKFPSDAISRDNNARPPHLTFGSPAGSAAPLQLAPTPDWVSLSVSSRPQRQVFIQLPAILPPNLPAFNVPHPVCPPCGISSCWWPC